MRISHRVYTDLNRIVLALWIMLLVPSSYAEDFVCHWAQGPVVIDGSDSDAAWTHADVMDKFWIPASAASRPQTATRTRLLWDRQYLYFFAELEDHDLFADVTEHDGKTWDNDVFEIFLKPSRSATGYYEF